MADRNVALIGFMGTGKSSIGMELASRLGFRFVDIDSLIEQRAGCRISEIFETKGESFFRELEQRTVEEVTLRRGQVIACGGGATKDPHMRRVLSTSCRIVLLKANPSTILQRISGDGNRPLATSLGSVGDVEAMLAARREAYSVYDVAIDTDRLSVAEAADAIVSRLRENDGLGDAQRVRVELGGRSYLIHVGERLMLKVGELVQALGGSRRALIVTDSAVQPLYAADLRSSLEASGISTQIFAMPQGEEHKSLATAQRAYEACAEAALDRSSYIVALGGGVVGDTAGFVASTYMRGVGFVQVPTTLLAMVDSSVGGKTAVNTSFGKNLVGTFYQPKLVIIDPLVLSSLSPRDYRAGMVELVKHALLRDPALLALLTSDVHLLTEGWRDESICDVIARSCLIKAEIVEADELDHGTREYLNLGHTIGHAIEAAAGYGALRHGEAVALGLIAETRAAAMAGIASSRCLTSVESCIQPLLQGVSVRDLDIDSVWSLMLRDKKNRDGSVRFSVLKEVGEPQRSVELPRRLVTEAIESVLRSQGAHPI